MHEYGLPIAFETALFETVRWVSADDPAALSRFVERQRSAMADDLDGDAVFMAESAFNLRWVMERNPEIRFTDIKTTSRPAG